MGDIERYPTNLQIVCAGRSSSACVSICMRRERRLFILGRAACESWGHRPVGDSYYILCKGGDPVAAALVPSMNPGFPEEILVGNTRGIIGKAESLLRCQHPVPLFVKLFENRWEYAGMYGNPLKDRRPGRVRGQPANPPGRTPG